MPCDIKLGEKSKNVTQVLQLFLKESVKTYFGVVDGKYGFYTKGCESMAKKAWIGS